VGRGKGSDVKKEKIERLSITLMHAVIYDNLAALVSLCRICATYHLFIDYLSIEQH